MQRNNKISLSELTNTAWREFSIYNINERAIPSMIDGLKPSQRFILYSAIKNAKDKFTKIVEIAGPVSSYGYHHGEGAAQDSATYMGAAWRNNTPLLIGDGNFGTRIIKEASAARYIYAKLSNHYHDIFADNDLCPANEDEDIKTPKYYLPLIPYVLLNGISGVATGFACNILPYDAKEVTKLCMNYLSGKNIDNASLTPKYPQFKGTIEKTCDNSYNLVGTYTLVKNKLTITEIPYQYDREEYIQVLDSLEEKGIVTKYDEDCVDGFKFNVTLAKTFKGDIISTFKLSKSVTENLNVITADGNLREYKSPIQLIKDFVDFRLGYVDVRIEKEKSSIREDMDLIKSKIKFIEYVLDNKIDFKEKSKTQLKDVLLGLKFKESHIDVLLNMNFYHLTTDEIDKLSDKYLSLNDRLEYLKNTTKEVEYGIDLMTLYKKFK